MLQTDLRSYIMLCKGSKGEQMVKGRESRKERLSKGEKRKVRKMNSERGGWMRR
jgi:hypothetical protein